MIRVPGYHPMRKEDRAVWEALQALDREFPASEGPPPVLRAPRVTATRWIRFLKWLRRWV